MKKIIFYKTEKNKSPVEEFLDNLNSQEVSKVLWTLKLIEELQNPPRTYLKKLVNTDDIWEVRIRAGNNTFRILGFMNGNNFLILNHAFQKKTQKTPAQAIRLAEKRKNDYLQRNKL